MKISLRQFLFIGAFDLLSNSDNYKVSTLVGKDP
jgi:hypothetical protein